MNRFEEGLKVIEERCGNGKDNVISLATIALEPNEDGKLRPFVREVDAMYEDGVFYITTCANSLKMQQIAKNPEVAFAVGGEWFSGNGIAENLRWIKEPKNSELREKLRKAFAPWYDMANNEEDKNLVILAVRITNATVIKNHHAVRYDLDFVNKSEGMDRRFR